MRLLEVLLPLGEVFDMKALFLSQWGSQSGCFFFFNLELRLEISFSTPCMLSKSCMHARQVCYH